MSAKTRFVGLRMTENEYSALQSLAMQSKGNTSIALRYLVHRYVMGETQRDAIENAMINENTIRHTSKEPL